MPLLLDKEEGKEGRDACISGFHPSSLQASSAEVVLELQFPFSLKCSLSSMRMVLQNVKCSAVLDPHRPVTSYQLDSY